MTTTKNEIGQTKYFCPKHPSNIRFLNSGVKMVVCWDCLENMIPEGQPKKQNKNKVQDQKLI